MPRDLQVNILAPSAQFEAGVKRMETSARALHASELRLIATEERLERLRASGKASVGQLASAQASLITAQDHVAKAHGRTAATTEQSGRRSSKAFDAVSRSASAMSTGVGLAGAAAGTAVVAFARQTVDAASDLQEQMSATRTIFKDAAADVLAFADTADAIGVSTRAALEASNTFGDLFTKLGYTHDAAAVFSEDLVRIAADFASFRNLSPEDVLEKLRSGLAGESEPLRALGVFLTEAKVSAEGMRLGLADAHGELDDGAKVAARYSLIMQGMGQAQGDVARTADSYANTQRRAAAEAENLQATIGQQLLPVMGDAAFVLGELAGALAGTADATDDAAAGLDWFERALGRASEHAVYGKSGFELIADAIRYFKGESEDAAGASDYLADSQAALADKQARAREEVQASVQEVEAQQRALENASPAVRAYAEELGLGADAIKVMGQTLEGWGEQLASFIDPLGAYTSKLEEKDAAERASAEETAAGTKSAKDSWEDYFDTQSVSFDEYIAELQEQVAAQQEWSTNMLQLAGRVSEGTLEELARMGPEGAPLIADLVGRSDTELAKMEKLFAARSKNAVDAQALQWRQWGVLAPQLTARIGKDAVAGLAKELEAGTTTVAKISRRYAFELAGGITPLLRAVGKSGVTESMVRQDVAMIQRNATRRAAGGPVWGAGTATSDSIPALLSNGEYVIRASSVAQYGQDFFDALNAGRFALGGMVRRFAAGGFATTANVPRPPSTAPFGPPVSTAAAATMDTAYQAAMQAVQTLVPQLMSFTGGASAKGLNPQFLQMFNAYNAAIGGVLRIVSGWRSSAQQAVLYQRWINRVPGQAPAAPPGRSNHERGLAIDHAPHSTPRMRAVAGAYGLRYPMSYEPWHVEPANLGRVTHRMGGPVRGMARGGAVSPIARGQTLASTASRMTNPAQIRALVSAWEDYNDVLEQAARRQELVAKHTQSRVAFERKRTQDNREQYARAITDLREFDAQARRVRDRARAERRADLLERAVEVRERSLENLSRLLDEERQLRDRQVELEREYAERIADIQQQRQADEQRIVAGRRTQLEQWAQLDQVASVSWGNTIDQLLGNARDQAAQFEEWMSSLADARARGVSEQVIAALGLDQGPEALGQLRQFGQATAAEIDALNAEVVRRTQLASQQARREQQGQLGEVGRELAAVQERYAEEMIEAQSELLVRQAELETELAAVGREQGRGYGTALAEGLRSQIPAVVAAAQALRAAAGGRSAPASMQKGRYVDTVTGRLAYYGPNGEPGSAARTALYSAAHRMPDGRVAYYAPSSGRGSAVAPWGGQERGVPLPVQRSAGLTVQVTVSGPVFGVDDLHRQIEVGAQAAMAKQRTAFDLSVPR